MAEQERGGGVDGGWPGTAVCVAIWAFVEFIVILCGGVRDRYGRPLA